MLKSLNFMSHCHYNTGYIRKSQSIKKIKEQMYIWYVPDGVLPHLQTMTDWTPETILLIDIKTPATILPRNAVPVLSATNREAMAHRATRYRPKLLDLQPRLLPCQRLSATAANSGTQLTLILNGCKGRHWCWAVNQIQIEIKYKLFINLV